MSDEKGIATNVAQEKKQEPRMKGQVVYCGPSIKGLAPQYTVYSDGLPEAFYAEGIPAAVRALAVPLEKFPETRRKLSIPGTAEVILYKKATAGLKERADAKE